MLGRVTVDRYISEGGGGISEGSIEFADGSRIDGTVRTAHCDAPATHLSVNTTALEKDEAKLVFAWGQVMLGLDEGESREMELSEMRRLAEAWES